MNSIEEGLARHFIPEVLDMQISYLGLQEPTVYTRKDFQDFQNAELLADFLNHLCGK